MAGQQPRSREVVGLSQWSFSVRGRRARAERRRVTLYGGGGAAMLLSGLALITPVVYENGMGSAEVQHEATATSQQIERDWQNASSDPGRVTTPVPSPDSGPAPSYPHHFDPAQIFAVLHIPAIGIEAPIAEGVDKPSVLDRGWVGHYAGTQETAFPWQGPGNFALAAHRNTHGEPFRYLDQVKLGDEVVVETALEFFVYRITGGLSEVSPADVGVLRPVPAGSGFTGSGHYLTLTTCTPDFTSWYRLIRFGVLVRDVPRALQPTGIPSL